MPSERLARELGKIADTPFGQELIHYITRLEETAEPSWVDMAVLRVTDEGLQMPATIQILAARVAKARLRGADHKQRRRVAPAQKEVVKEMAMTTMAALTGCGMKPREAAQRTAEALHSVHGWAGVASTIQRDYNRFRHTSECRAIVEATQRDFAANPAFLSKLLEELGKLPRREPGVYN